MRDVIDEWTPGTIDWSNAANFVVAGFVVLLYQQGHLEPMVALSLIAAALGVDTLAKGRKPKPVKK